MLRDLKTELAFVLAALSTFIISGYSTSVCQTKPDTSIIGMWQGTLNVGGAKLRLVFHVTKTDSGTLVSTLDSPDQGAKGIPVSKVTVSGDSVIFTVGTVGGAYEGKFSDDSGSIDGKWKQSGADFPLVLTRTTVEIKYNRPQEPKPPFPYKAEEVSFDSKATGMKYTGTLTLPDSGGPFPAAILITGSGVHDRNEDVFGHKPFLVIADYLTRRGIAVLRVDDRGVGGSTGNKMEATSADHAKDVIAEIEFLKSRSEINPKEIGLIGHSEGGIIAPMVAAESKDVSFIVMLAGTGMTGGEIIIEQTKLISKSEGVPEEKIEQEVNQDENVFRIIKSSSDSTTIADSLKKYLRTTLPQSSSEGEKNKGDSEKAIEAKAKSLLSPWFRYFIAYDPVPALEKVKCPVLAMDGTLDLQVPPEENLRIIGDALKKSGNKDYTIKLMPGLNHLFQDAKTGSPNEYVQIEETFSPEALKVMGDWIVEKAGKK